MKTILKYFVVYILGIITAIIISYNIDSYEPSIRVLNIYNDKGCLLYEGKQKYCNLTSETIGEKEVIRVIVFNDWGKIIFCRRFFRENIEIQNY